MSELGQFCSKHSTENTPRGTPEHPPKKRQNKITVNLNKDDVIENHMTRNETKKKEKTLNNKINSEIERTTKRTEN